jgi:PAS domain S-box-containing protein
MADKRSKYYWVILFFLFSLLPRNSVYAQNDAIALTKAEQNWLDQKHIVRVRVGNWPPFMFSEGKFSGISVDYIEKIFSLHGIDYQFISDKEVPWKVALENIKKHQAIDLIPTAKITEKRKESMVFTDEYLFLPWVIFSRTDSPFIGGIDDLVEKTVCVPDGYVMHGLLAENYPEINLHLISGTNVTPRCIEALAQAKVDAYVGNLAVGSYIIQSKGYTNVRVAAPTPFGTHNQAMAIRDDWPELASIISKTLRNFSPAEHAEIRNKWLSIRYEHGIRPMDVFKWVLGVSSVLILILLIILFWNRRLNKEILVRQKVEQKLRESENKYRSLSDAAFEGIVVTDKGEIIDANNTIATMFGYSSPADHVGMNILNFVSPEYREEVQNKILTGYEKPYEIQGVKKDGTNFPIQVHAKMCSFRGRQVRVTAVRDLTEQKEAEEEIRNLRDILPICSYCKNIRNDEGYYEQIEAYIRKHSGVDLSHTICPDCMKEHYPEIDFT